MVTSRLAPLLVGCLLAAPLGPSPAAAEDYAAGRGEYLAACAARHGESADGNGPMAELFREPVPDLTGIAARNDGVFPTEEIMQVVDGRREIRAHGSPMPVFGNPFVHSHVSENWYSYAIGNSEQLARARVLELVLYLQSIQR
jgi:hypothetical protein